MLRKTDRRMRMLGLLLFLVPFLDSPSAPPPELLARLPPAYLGNAAAPGACRGPLPEPRYGVIGKSRGDLLADVASDPSQRIGGCDRDAGHALQRLRFPDLRALDEARSLAQPSVVNQMIALVDESCDDLIAWRCVSRTTLRPYASLTLLGGALSGLALDVAPSRTLVTVRLIDTRV